MRDILANLRVPESPPLPPKKRWGKPALLLLGGAVIGAAPFLFHIWGGQQSRKLSFEHAIAIAVDASSPEDVIQTAFGRLTILCEDGFNSLHTLKKQRPAFQPAVRSVLGRLDSLLKNRQLVRKKRPNTLSYAEALDGVVNARSSDALVQTCLDLIVYDIEEAIRGLQALLKKGGEPGEGAANFLSWFPRFLEGQ